MVTALVRNGRLNLIRRRKRRGVNISAPAANLGLGNDNMQGHLKDNKYNEGYAKGWDEAKHEDKVKAFQDDLYKKDDDDMFS